VAQLNQGADFMTSSAAAPSGATFGELPGLAPSNRKRSRSPITTRATSRSPAKPAEPTQEVLEVEDADRPVPEVAQPHTPMTASPTVGEDPPARSETLHISPIQLLSPPIIAVPKEPVTPPPTAPGSHVASSPTPIGYGPQAPPPTFVESEADRRMANIDHTHLVRNAADMSNEFLLDLRCLHPTSTRLVARKVKYI